MLRHGLTWLGCTAVILLLVLPGSARAQDAGTADAGATSEDAGTTALDAAVPGTPASPPASPPEEPVGELTVVASRPMSAASSETVRDRDLQYRPRARPADIFEVAPGL